MEHRRGHQYGRRRDQSLPASVRKFNGTNMYEVFESHSGSSNEF